MTTPSEGYPAFATDLLVEVKDGKSYANRIPPTTELKASGLKYQQPASRALMNYQFYLINKWIEELDVRTSGAGATPSLGWIYYEDTQYTQGSPFVVNAGVTATLPNNAGVIDSTSAPTDGSSFYNGSVITPNNVGDAYTISIRMNASSSSNDGSFLLEIDIGDGVTPIIIIGDTRRLIKGAGQTQRITFDFTFFTKETFIANSGTVKVTSITGNTSISDIGYMIQRTFNKDNS